MVATAVAPETKECVVCGAMFERSPKWSRQQFAERAYCSRECFAETRRKPKALCDCGCGERVPLHGYRFVSGHGWPLRCKPVWLDNTHGRWYTNDRSNTQVAWARVVMENVIGRPLRPEEVVHHLNEDPADDRPENLALCASQAVHMRLYHSIGVWRAEKARQRTHCNQGHLLSGVNLAKYELRRGRKTCLACRRLKRQEQTR